MGFYTPEGIYVASGSLLDAAKGPWDTLQQFFDEVPVIFRAKGQEILVEEPDGYARYQLVGGINIEHAKRIFADTGNVDEVQFGRGGLYIDTGFESALNLQSPIFAVNTPNNYDIVLPEAAEAIGAEVTARKLSDNAYAVTLSSETAETRLLGDTDGNGITTIEPGAWVKIKSIKISEGVYKWVVIGMGGEWDLIT